MIRHTGSLANILLAAMMAVGTIPATAADPPSGEFDLQASVEEFTQDQQGGVAALIRRNGEVTTAVAGQANRDGDPIELATPFRIASTSKPFTAVMVLELVDEGRVDLDAPLSTYLPDTPLGGDATIRSLLGHRSGVPDSDPRIIDDLLADPDRSWTPADQLAYADTDGGGTVPGEFSYSNLNYVLLGQLIEALDGADLATAFRTRIAEPLALEDMMFAIGGNTDKPERLAAGWMEDFGFYGDPEKRHEAFESSAYAQGGLTATLDSLLTVLDALFGGELISTELLGQMGDTGAEPYGYGLGLMSDEIMVGDVGLETSFVGHAGIHPLGFWSTMLFDPSTGDAVIVLTNDIDNVSDDLAAEILEAWPSTPA